MSGNRLIVHGSPPSRKREYGALSRGTTMDSRVRGNDVVGGLRSSPENVTGNFPGLLD